MSDSSLTDTDDFVESLNRAWPTSKWVNVRVLVAFSGGPDSTALVRGLLTLQPDRSKLAVAHFNHRLRGAASDEDQSFVERTARHLGVKCYLQSAGPGSIELDRSGQGIESAARSQRYAFLIRTAERIGARYLVTGHTIDDQIETVLHRILRGTGLAGLAGIPASRPASQAVTLVRPLLSTSRSDVLSYLQRLGQKARDDETNQQTCFTRGRIRHELLPLLKRDFNPDLGEALLRLSRIANEAQDAIRQIAIQWTDHCILRETREELRIDLTRLHEAPLHLQREIFVVIWQRRSWPLQAMGFLQWQQLAELINEPEKRHTLNLPGDIQASRVGNEVRLRSES